LLSALTQNDGDPSSSSRLTALAQADLEKQKFLPSRLSTEIEKPVAAKPVPPGYYGGIYRDVLQLAQEGKDPTSEQLSQLFRIMSYDSPEGELKDEALAIWREMRSRGVVPTITGYVALLKVVSPSVLRA